MLRYIIMLAIVAGLFLLYTLKLGDNSRRNFAVISEYKVEGNAEIIQVAADGMYIVHTNSKRSSIDVVDLLDPKNPQTVASLSMPGEPTSVGVSPDGNWAMAVVYPHSPSPGKKPRSPLLPGILALIDLNDPANASVVTTIGIGHHPDSITVTSAGDELLAIIGIENEPVIIIDGKVADTKEPGHPDDISSPGAIQILAINPDQPNRYSMTNIELDANLLRNALMLYPDDPQPEYSALSPGKHLAAVYLQ
jgi:hypothetical protein